MALLSDGQGQEHAGGDGYVTHDITGREQHPESMIMISQVKSFGHCKRFFVFDRFVFVRIIPVFSSFYQTKKY